MHRGSSKGAGSSLPTPETLPLSASPAGGVPVVLEVTRASSTQTFELVVPRSTLLRDVLRQVGLASEGSAVLLGDTPLPLDTPIESAVRITVVPTFSGG